MIAHQLLSTVWNFCYVLRDDGVSCVDYIEQLTLLIFMKIMDENSKLSKKRKMNLPKNLAWQSLITKQGEALHKHYNKVLTQLGALPGMVGQIFEKTQNKIQDPHKLEKLIQLINRETWSTLGADLNGNLYEHLIERMAKDTRKSAGQYFTPRPLVKVIVECIRPLPNKTVHDPACGTGGFLLGAYDFLIKHHFSKQRKKTSFSHIFSGNEIVSSTRRLCLMNLLLQGIGSVYQKKVYIKAQDALLGSLKQYDYVLANPPFGKTSSIKTANKKGNLCRERVTRSSKFWVTTSNKVLNFLQHIKTILKSTGSAAVIVPDSVLFEGGAAEIVRVQLLKTTNLHTILRLPTGLFSAETVKTHVLFFDNKPQAKAPWTQSIWFYDYRTNIQHSFRKNPLQSECLAEFISCYHAKNRSQCKATWSEKNSTGRWKKIDYAEIMARDKCNLDVVWLKDNTRIDPDTLPHPTKIVEDVVDELSVTLEKFLVIKKTLMKIP
ncbi:MAG TPA: class I SAM-dependent DNA methyltransferase [Gammaproteobacteria bacterium]|nr:class I SAM-dependent DNA methyltransferase [Gammaproteobacteria bacterium]